MPNPFTRAQTLENAAFLRALRRTGNAKEAAREIGKSFATIWCRQRAHPAFAARWKAALTVATARLHEGGGARRPGEGAPSSLAVATRAKGPRTQGGEETVVLLRNGTLQVRRARADKLTHECEQAFFAALSSTANVSLAAAAAGASTAAFYRRKRNDPGFAREWRLALQQGYQALEMALVAGTLVDAHEDDAWRHNDPPPIPAMTANQAIQLLYLHQKEARLWATRPDIYARKPGETSDSWSKRRGDNYVAELARAAEDSQLARVVENDRRRSRWEPPAPVLPALDQVTGWSRAKRPGPGEPPEVNRCGFAEPPAPDPAGGQHHPDTALFGGWRLEDLSPEQRAKGEAALDEARRRPWNPDKVRARPNRGRGH